jgi:hypothetical protein
METTIPLCSFDISYPTFKNSIIIRDVKVMDVTIKKESWKRMIARNMITAAWNKDFHVQIINVLKLRYLPA